MKNIVIILLLAFSVPLLADNSDKKKNRERTITGKITDAYGQTIAGAYINIPETGQTFYSDLDGNFKITFSAENNLTIRVSTLGFEPNDLQSGQLSAFTDISLRPLKE